MLADLKRYSKTAIGIAESMRAPLPSDPEGYLRRALEQREETFLRLVKRVIFDRPDHPYVAMFRGAGCEFGDLAGMVRSDGLEAVLPQLREGGVYLTHDEWKGRTPIVRGGVEIPCSRDSFRNPFVSGWMESVSSGSTGAPVRSVKSKENRYHNWAYNLLRTREFEMDRKVNISLKPILPSTHPITSAVHARRMGAPQEAWYAVGSIADSWHYRAMTAAMITVGNLMGARAPYPQYLDPNDFSPVVEHIARRKQEGKACVVNGFASPLVRVAGAAKRMGADISGTTFLSGGEALTPGKLDMFDSVGARAYTGYAITEVSHVGMPCKHLHGNTVHLMQDSIAAIVYRRPSPYGDGVEVDSLHLTTLRAEASLVFINVEMDDSGQILPATCDCTLSRLGYRTLITDINSFGKLSPQGATLYGTDLQRVLEEELPAQLGGEPGDYQLVECESEHSRQTQLQLYVSPRLGLEATAAQKVFLKLVRARWGGALATRFLAHSEGIQTVIAEPHATQTGKVHPIRLLGRKEMQREVTPA